MASVAMRPAGRTSANLLILLLGTAIFLTYVDRGSIAVAAPLMKGELGLSNEAYGLAVSAFFWVYAPIQLFAGWLCDRFSVYRLLALGITLWAASTLLMGFVGGFASLFVLRVMLGIGESLAFPGSSKIIAEQVPPERRGVANSAVAMGIAFGPAVGTLLGGLMVAHWGWRAMFVVFGAVTLVWLLPWQQAVRSLAQASPLSRGRRVEVGAIIAKRSLWAMAIGHCLNNYCFYFLLAWLPLFLTKSRGFSITEMTFLATLGYAVQAACAFTFGHFSDWWTRSGRSEAACRRMMMVASQALAAGAILGLAFAHGAVAIGLLLCVAGAGSALGSTNLYAVAQMFAGPRASGTWVGLQNSIGNLSGIVGPVISGIIIDRGGYTGAFMLTAVVAGAGALWWMFALPEIRPISFECAPTTPQPA